MSLSRAEVLIIENRRSHLERASRALPYSQPRTWERITADPGLNTVWYSANPEYHETFLDLSTGLVLLERVTATSPQLSTISHNPLTFPPPPPPSPLTTPSYSLPDHLENRAAGAA